MNPVTSAAGEMIATDILMSIKDIFNDTGSANAPMQHDPQLLQEKFLWWFECSTDERPVSLYNPGVADISSAAIPD